MAHRTEMRVQIFDGGIQVHSQTSQTQQRPEADREAEIHKIFTKTQH